MTVDLETFQLLPREAVRRECRALEAVPDVGQIRDPAEVDGDCVEGHEEAREEQEWDRHDGGEENAVLKKKHVSLCFCWDLFGLFVTWTFMAAPTTRPTLWATNDTNKHAPRNIPYLKNSKGWDVMK